MLNTEHVKDIVWVITPQFIDFEYVSDYLMFYGYFSSGLARVRFENDEYMFVDKKGEIAFPGVKLHAEGNNNRNFTRHLPMARNGEGDYYELNITGRKILTTDYRIIFDETGFFPDLPWLSAVHFPGRSSGYLTVSKSVNNKYGLTNRIGQWIVEPVYNDISIRADDILAVARRGSRNGFLTNDLDFVFVSTDWILIGDFNNGFAPTSHSVNEFTTLHNFIDMQGNFLLQEDITAHASDSSPLISDRIIRYSQNGLFGFMTIEGKIIIEPKYSSAGVFSEDLAYAQLRPGRGGYINKDGNTVLSIWRCVAGGQFKNGMASVNVMRRGSEMEGVVDNVGNWIIKPGYDSAFYVKDYNVWELNKLRQSFDGTEDKIIDIYFVDRKMLVRGYENVEIISPTAFTGWQGFSAYFVDINGANAAKYRFEDIAQLSERLIAVRKGGRCSP